MWGTTKSTPPAKEQEKVSYIHAQSLQLYPTLYDPVNAAHQAP